jgi:hypothetical protein
MGHFAPFFTMQITTSGTNQPRILRSHPLNSDCRNYEVDVFFHILHYYYYPELDKLLKNDNNRKDRSSQKKSC